jgi:hypothetical protein
VTGCVIEGTRDRLVRLQPHARWLTSATPTRLHHSCSIPPLPPRSSSAPPALPAAPPGPDRHHTRSFYKRQCHRSSSLPPPRNLTSTPPPPRTSLRSATSLAGTPPSLPLWAGPPPVTRKAHNATGRGEAFSIYISNTQRLNHDHCMVCWFYYKLLYETLCCVLELCTLLYQIFFPLIYFFFRF